MALAGMLVAVVLAIGARPIVIALAGEDYAPAADVLRIQCLGSRSIFVTSAFSPALLGMGRVRELAIASGAGVAAVIVFGAALIVPWDATGAAVAAVGADVVLCAATYLALRRAAPPHVLDASGSLDRARRRSRRLGRARCPGCPTRCSR